MISSPGVATRANRLWSAGLGARDDVKSGIALAAIFLLAIAISPARIGWVTHLSGAGQSDGHPAPDFGNRHYCAGHDVRDSDGRDRSERGQHAGARHIAGRDVSDARRGRRRLFPPLALSRLPACASDLYAGGGVNGVVISALRIQPFIVTLASMIGIRGLAKWLTNNANIDIGFGHGCGRSIRRFFDRRCDHRDFRRAGSRVLGGAGADSIWPPRAGGRR